MEQQLTNTRITALRKQIVPHLLFNTLATLRRLHQTKPAAGAGMLANFIDYLRRVLPMLDRSAVPRSDEIELIRDYLSIIEIRMTGRLIVEFRVPLGLRRSRVPPLALTTLVENAVKHGIALLPRGGGICVSASAVDGSLELIVADDGTGLSESSGAGTGIGLYNVFARLATLYGVYGSLTVEGNRPSGVRARISLSLSAEA